ncbi:MAG: MFS transporter [Anaerolineales bacterium]
MNIEQQIEEHLRHNYIVNFIDGVAFWLGSSFFATRTILPLFISQLSDSTLAIGILSAVVSTGWLIPQLFTANWVRRQPIKKFIPVNIGFFAERLPIIGLAGVAWLAIYSKPAALVLGLFCAAWFHVGAGIVAVGWQDMIAKLFSIRTRGRFMGITFFVGTVAGILGATIASWVLETYPFPQKFIISFAIGALFIMVSWIALAFTKEPPDEPQIEPIMKSVDWEMIGQIIKTDQNFVRYVTAAVITSLGSMAIGFLTVYTLDKWDISNSLVGTFTTFLLIGQAIGYLIFGWLSDRTGHKIVLEIGTVVGAASLGLAILAPSPEVFYLVFLLMGINNAAWTLSGINIIFEFCPANLRPTYIGLANTVIGIFSGIAPLIGGFLVDGLSYAWMFFIALGLTLSGAAALRFRVAEPRFHTNTEAPGK